MDVHIGEVNSTLRMGADAAGAPGSPSFERLVAAVAARLRREMALDRRVEEDRRLRPGSSVRETTSWESP